MRTRLDFIQWPTDLVIDYALKVHHRTIREKGPEILYLLGKLSAKYPELEEVHRLFAGSLTDLDEHLIKEENILFPLVGEILSAAEQKRPVQAFHCGSVQNPISVMMADHEGETERHERIKQLTNNYTAPSDAPEEYTQVLIDLAEFKEALEEHIYIEDEIIFPRAIELEQF